MTISELKENFALIDDWEDRYRYVIELGRALPELPVADKTEANKVRGCASQVWLVTRLTPQTGGASTTPADFHPDCVPAGGSRQPSPFEADASPLCSSGPPHFAVAGIRCCLRAQSKPHDALEKFENTIEPRIVSQILDDAAGMCHRRAVAGESPSGVGEAASAGNMNEIHRHLPRQRDPRGPARNQTKLSRQHAKHLTDTRLDDHSLKKQLLHPFT